LPFCRNQQRQPLGRQLGSQRQRTIICRRQRFMHFQAGNLRRRF
jgi:hypothetical protein